MVELTEKLSRLAETHYQMQSILLTFEGCPRHAIVVQGSLRPNDVRKVVTLLFSY